MGTFDDLAVGDTVHTPRRTVTEAMVTLLSSLGGYTHPLFTDLEHVRSETPFQSTPLPGEGLLLLMGGLVEQSGVFDGSTLALVGFDRTVFHQPAFAGSTVGVEVTVLDRRRSASGRRGTLVLGWRCVDGAGGLLADTTATLLFRLD